MTRAGGPSGLGLLCSLLAATSGASASTGLSESQLQWLRNRGLDPAATEHLRHGPRFAPGPQRVTLRVNGHDQGPFEATFTGDGRLCFNSTLVQAARLVPPTANATPEHCHDAAVLWPQSEIELHPQRGEVALLISRKYLLAATLPDQQRYVRTGTAGLLNYDFMTFTSQTATHTSDIRQLNTELGFNSHGWILRSRQALSERDGERRFTRQAAYAQASLERSRTRLQLGELNIVNPVLAGAPILGLQLLPEQALGGTAESLAVVQGVAQSQARVEVRQLGQLLHTSLVAAGPFRLGDIQPLSRSADLQVQVTESDGSQQRFSVPAAALAQVALQVPASSLAVGRVRQPEGLAGQTPTILAASTGTVVGERHKVTGAALLTDGPYQALGAAWDSQLNGTSGLSLRTQLADSDAGRGARHSLTLSTRVGPGLGLNVNASYQTAQYQDLMAATTAIQGHADGAGQRRQLGLGASWHSPQLGSFGASLSTSQGADSERWHYFNASWQKRFSRLNLSLDLDRSLSRGPGAAQTSLSLSLSAPLGGRSHVRGYLRQRGDSRREGLELTDTHSAGNSYRLAWEQQQSGQDGPVQNLSTGVNLSRPWAQVNLDYGRESTGANHWSAYASGGVAFHEHGVTLAPHGIGDTFAIASVGGLPGVRLETNSGPVWTDGSGRAVVSRLVPYRSDRLQLATRTLPRNTDVANAHTEVAVGRGAVAKVDFAVNRNRRILLHIAGAPLHKGLSVVDDEGQYVTSLLGNGKLLLEGALVERPLHILLEGGQRCPVTFQLPETPATEQFYEALPATCTPVSHAYP